MKPLACLAALALPVLLTSCGVANGLIQPARGLIDSGMRTISDVDDSNLPEQREESETMMMALKTQTGFR